jgi:predicted outer membrane protein
VTDRDIVAWISADNDAEIQFSQMAQQKSSNEQVKQFAQQMVEEHGQLAQKLQQAAGTEQDAQAGTDVGRKIRLGVNRKREEQESEQPQPADAQQEQQREGAENADQAQVAANDQAQQRTARRLRMAERHRGLTAFHAEIVQECLQQKQQMLGEKQGAEFDKCFMQAQIGAHVGAIATLQVAQKHAQSSELKQALQEAEQTTKQHLDHAVALFEQLDKGGAGEGAQKKPAGQRQTQEGQREQPANQN